MEDAINNALILARTPGAPKLLKISPISPTIVDQAVR
jgi:hypothetical protein